MQEAAKACWATGQRDATARGADGCSGQVPDALLCQVTKNVDAPEVPEDPPWVAGGWVPGGGSNPGAASSKQCSLHLV
jgi:hypothetical protein